MTCKRILIDSTKLIRSMQPEMCELFLTQFCSSEMYFKTKAYPENYS